MQGSKNHQDSLFVCVAMSDLVPADHLVRKLNKVVDLDWVRLATADYYSGMGRPSVDPVVIAKMLLLSFLVGIDSERELLRQIQVNIAYRWYLGYSLEESVPNHSVLSKARRRFGKEFFERLFSEVLSSCRGAGLVDGDTILVDSTMIHANASMDSIKTYWRKLEDKTDDGIDSKSTLGSKKSGSKLSQSRRSTTDPDATFINKPGQRGIGYKANVAADSANGVITAVTVSTAEVDDTAAVPELIEANPDASTIVADGLYGSHDCLEYLQERGLETVIKHRGGGNKHGKLAKSEFEYRSIDDCYICPQGATLKRTRTDRKKRKAIYSCSSDHCDVCSLRSQCIGERQAGSVRQVTRYDTPYIERAEQAVGTRRGRKLLTVRQTCIEGLFGQAKQWHGLARARWRGLEHVEIQALITTAVLNIKKLIKAAFNGGSRKINTAAKYVANAVFGVILALCSIFSRENRCAARLEIG